MQTYKNNTKKLAEKLGYSEARLYDIIDNAPHYYVPFHLVTTRQVADGKSQKKIRHIDNPTKKLPLRELQRSIKKKLLSPESSLLDSSLKGGIKKRNMVDFLRPHIGKKTVVCMDLKNCFPSISRDMVHSVWTKQLGYSNEVATLLTKATCFHNYLPQGAPTSSLLCNFVLNPMAQEARELLEANNGSYTQYIDDVCFSGDDITVRRLINEIYRISKKNRQKIKKSKSLIMDSKHRQMTMGIVINKKTKMDIKYIKTVKARITEETKTGFINSKSQLSIAGQILYVEKYDPASAKLLGKLLDESIQNVYDSDEKKVSIGEAKPCRLYRYSRLKNIKCTYLVT